MLELIIAHSPARGSKWRVNKRRADAEGTRYLVTGGNKQVAGKRGVHEGWRPCLRASHEDATPSVTLVKVALYFRQVTYLFPECLSSATYLSMVDDMILR